MCTARKPNNPPRAGFPVVVCGDCYSSLQGWVEGALNTAELMLQAHFGMKHPDWLKDVYLGF